MFGSCDDVSKIVLIALNVAVGLLSIALVGVGIWALTSDYGANEISALITTDLFTASCVLVIVAGVILFLLAFLGGLATLLESRVLLFIYCGLLGVFLLVAVIGTIVGFFFLDEIEDELADNMRETLTEQYGVNITVGNNEAVTEVWNNIQRDLKCCGVRGSLNSTESWFLWQSSLWFVVEGISIHTNDISKWWFVPSSCCSTDFTFDTCQDYNAGNSQPPKQNLDEVTEANPALHHDGCLDKLKDKVREHIIAITVAAALLFIVLVVCMLLSMYMLCTGAGQQAKVHDSSQSQCIEQEAKTNVEDYPKKQQQQQQQQQLQQQQQQVHESSQEQYTEQETKTKGESYSKKQQQEQILDSPQEKYVEQSVDREKKSKGDDYPVKQQGELVNND